MSSIKDKIGKWFLITAFSLPVILVSAGYLFRLSMTKSCAKITDIDYIKGYSTYKIRFMKDGEFVNASINSQTIKHLDIDSLKKIDCLEIEYSNVWYIYVSVVDKKYGTGKEW